MVEWSRQYRVGTPLSPVSVVIDYRRCRNPLFLTSAGPNVKKRDPRYFVQATIFIAIVMVVLGSGIASAGASHVVARLGISDGPHDREDRRLTRPVNYAWRILGLSMTLTGRSYVPLSRIDGHRQD
jgi:hypothetical protein